MRPTAPASPSRARLARRRLLGYAGFGFGELALGSLLRAENNLPLTGQPHHPPRAKNVIWLFMRGGVSHMESFDPKPALNEYAGKSIPDTPFADVLDPARAKEQRVVIVNDANGKARNTIYPLQVGSQRYGQCGLEVSDWFPHIGGCADDIAVVRSMWTTDNNHGAQVQFHSGRHMLDPRAPTIGAWVNYGLGSLNDNLPSFINMGPRFFDRRDGHYLGPAYDSVNLKVGGGGDPLGFSRPELEVSEADQLRGLGLTNDLNRLSAELHPHDQVLEARIRSYELAYRMQSAVPGAVDLAGESDETKALYGLDEDATRPFGQQLLAARRFAERGVRFIQIMHGGGAAGAWDQHSKLKEKHSELARQVDRPIAGLLQDLKRRGLLDETIVVFATEFGRTPGSQGADGRDHHPFGFSIWMAGGGIRGGTIHGATDELGFHAVDSPHYVTDVHATLLHLLGLDHRSLHVPGHKRLDRDYGQVIREILA